MKKRLSALLLSTAIVISLLPVPQAAAAVAHDQTHAYVNGFCPNGDCDSPYEPVVPNAQGVYEISNGGQLFWFSEFVRGAGSGANACLTADITVNNDTVSGAAGTISRES